MSFLVSSSKELIFMNKENLILRELLALILNIVLNLVLIPKFDAVELQ